MAESSVRDTLTPWKRQSFPAIAAKCEGALAILMESPTATLVRVSNIRADDWGVTVTITCVPLPGMRGLGRQQIDCCDISAAWGIFSANTASWYAQYCPWQLYFVPEAIEKFIALAAREAELGKQIDYRTARNCIAEGMLRRRSVGEAAI